MFNRNTATIDVHESSRKLQQIEATFCSDFGHNEEVMAATGQRLWARVWWNAGSWSKCMCCTSKRWIVEVQRGTLLR
jgi:hypothetical protein